MSWQLNARLNEPIYWGDEMKEFTHEEKVALLREFDVEGFEQAWNAVDTMACHYSPSARVQSVATYYDEYSVSLDDIAVVYAAKEALHTIRYEDGSYFEDYKTRTEDFARVIAAINKYTHSIEALAVRWMWPQYGLQGQIEVVELPELGDIV